jgi:hypothetical protein
MYLPQITQIFTNKKWGRNLSQVTQIITNKYLNHFIEKGEGNKLIKNFEMIIL